MQYSCHPNKEFTAFWREAESIKWNSRNICIFNKQDTALSVFEVAEMSIDAADNRSWMLFLAELHLVSNLECSR